jgi:hypothetical protein
MRKPYNKEIHNLYSSPSIIRMTESKRVKWAAHVARMGLERNVCRILVGNPKGKRPLERPTCRWQDNIKMALRKMGWGGIGWIDLV